VTDKTPALRRKPGPPWQALGGNALKALLTAPTAAKTTHFVLQVAADQQTMKKLPTGAAPDRTDSVDNSFFMAPMAVLPIGLALVVPKRHAKRAATRNLVKRQMREAVHRRLADWTGRQLLIRQRSSFDPKLFPSATSAALRETVRGELEALFARATTG
jgi:ribonuclease P protein component